MGCVLDKHGARRKWLSGSSSVLNLPLSASRVFLAAARLLVTVLPYRKMLHVNVTDTAAAERQPLPCATLTNGPS